MLKYFLCLATLTLSFNSPCPVQDGDDARRITEQYWETSMKDESVSSLFCWQIEAVRCFNVVSYKILDVKCDSFECGVKTSVESSTSNGRPIRKSWIVYVRTRNDGSCIRDVRETY